MPEKGDFRIDDATAVEYSLCLDFANTLSWRGRKRHEDRIKNYGNLVMWSQHVSILARSQAKRLLDEAGQRRSEAEAVFSRAIRLREVIYRIFSSIAGHSIPNKGDFAVLNEELSKAMAKIRITRNAQGYLWAFEDGEKALDQVLWPIVRSAADLLTSDRLDRIRSCADEECGWLFLDTSRNRSRRWCDMEDCGNRAKARRYYQRKHGISRRTTHNKTTRSV